MATRQLLVFVHGWGAGEPEWWGSTRTSLPAHKGAADYRFHFHTYPTTKAVRPNAWRRFWQLLGNEPTNEVIGESGQTLWSRVREQLAVQACDTAVLFGHSFGGLIIADAIRHADERARQGSKADEAALSKVSRIALCASPVDGADLAGLYVKLASPFGTNVHLQNLLKSDRDRKCAVDVFMGFLQRHQDLRLALFYATSDQVIDRNDLFKPFLRAGVSYEEVALDGGHSDCVQNIGPASVDRSANYERVARWLFEASPIRGDDAAPPPLPPPAPISKADPRLFRDSFDSLMRNLRSTIDAEPFLSWQDLREGSPVKDLYLLRIFFQQLIFAASRIDDHALGSANLWVAHLTPGRSEVHLRSEEREGFFAADQLVVYTPEQVNIRANKVNEIKGLLDTNSAGAQAYLKSQPVLIATKRSEFPSQLDTKAGITHILGIPLCDPHEFRQILSAQQEGSPLAITVDFHFDAEPDQDDVQLLVAAANQLTELYRTFSGRWPPGGLRLALQ